MFVYVIYFQGKKKQYFFIQTEKATETKFMEIPIVYEVSNLSHGLHKKSGSGEPEKETSPQTAATAGTSGGSQKQHFEFPPRPLLQVASQSSAYTDPMDAFNFDKPTYEYFTPLRLRPGAQKKLPVGFFRIINCFSFVAILNFLTIPEVEIWNLYLLIITIKLENRRFEF